MRRLLVVLTVGLQPAELAMRRLDPAENPPPDVMANGVPGIVPSYCRMSYCAHGGIDFASGSYPELRAADHAHVRGAHRPHHGPCNVVRPR